MPFHVHLSVIDFFKTMAYVLIGGTFIRLLQLKISNTAFGQALALAY